MSKIIVLDAVTANSIAAGEVVERPASVVKELCENALDAGADVISITIESGGIKRIRVTDNGSGMTFDQAALAFQQHATSKLKIITDLDSLVTMGFRGEALPSIAAVAKVELKTRTAELAEGTLVRVEGGRQVQHRTCGAAVGTTVTVDSLFYNTPARYKFLKKDTTEAARVTDVVERLVLARPDVSFRLLNNGRQILHSPGNNDLASAIYSVFSKVSAAALLPLESVDAGPVAVGGYITAPAQARKSRQWQLFFVNNRIVKAPLLTAALEEGYRSYLMKGQFPAAFIKLALPANLLDVNVHPQKTEVRFWDERAVFAAVSHAVKAALAEGQGPLSVETAPPPLREDSRANARHPLTEFKRRDETPLAPISDIESADPAKTRNSVKQDLSAVGKAGRPGDELPAWPVHKFNAGLSEQSPPKTTTAETKQAGAVTEDEVPVGTAEAGEPYKSSKTATDPGDRQSKAAAQSLDRILEGRYVGSLFNTYIIIESKDLFYLIDQHAAHEKINFEHLLALYRNRENRSQPLLTPVSLEVSTTEAALVESEQALFGQLGFEVELFGRDTVLVRSVPISSQTFSPVEAVRSLLDSLSAWPAATLSNRESESIYDMLATMACRASVKAHDRLSEAEVRALLKQMAALDNPWQCPHGRPAVLEIRDYELEKLFKRVV